MAAAFPLFTKSFGCIQYVEGTRIKFVAPVARIASIAAWEDTYHVVGVIEPPTGSFIRPKITLGLVLYMLASLVQTSAKTELSTPPGTPMVVFLYAP
jgi:hypothetical protein